MNSRIKSFAFGLTVLSIVGLSSCETNDAIPAPTISLHELGENNSKEAEPGSDLHIDAEIVAEGKIAKITIDIHPESGSGEDLEFEFTDDAGMKNLDFHEHIDIPASTEHGDYHFHMMVTDQEGQSASVEEELHIH